MDQGADASVFVAGGRHGETRSSFIEMVPTRLKCLANRRPPSRFYSLAAISRCLVYGATIGEGIWLWDGDTFRISLPAERGEITEVRKLYGKLFAYGQNGQIVYDPPEWTGFPFDLDDAFLK
jgi:hypothetical protein